MYIFLCLVVRNCVACSVRHVHGVSDEHIIHTFFLVKAEVVQKGLQSAVCTGERRLWQKMAQLC